MHYMLFICSDGVATPEKSAAMRSEIPRWLEEMEGRGVRRMGHALRAASTAHTVRVRNDEILVSDGPFTESKEAIGGFDVISCSDLDEAIEVAAKHPVSWFHSIEVRPFADHPTGPSGGDHAVAAPAELAELAGLAQDPALPAVAPGCHRYLLLVCADGLPGSDEEEAGIGRDIVEWLDRARGARVYGHALQGAEIATTVRVRGGETVISDGPFVETKEFVGGFDIVDCAGEDEAIALAAAHPLAGYHMVEVRRFADEE